MEGDVPLWRLDRNSLADDLENNATIFDMGALLDGLGVELDVEHHIRLALGLHRDGNPLHRRTVLDQNPNLANERPLLAHELVVDLVLCEAWNKKEIDRETLGGEEIVELVWLTGNVVLVAVETFEVWISCHGLW